MVIKAVVTGHSQGLGAAIADELLRRDIPVLGLARRRRDAASVPPGATRLEQVELDLSDARALIDWSRTPALRQFLSGADTVLLVNNAGTVQPVGPLEAQAPERLASTVALNVTAPLLLSQAVPAASPAAREHRIVHVSSGAARKPYAGWSAYCATKAALDHHARAVALDRTPGLRICSLAPGVIDTEMQVQVRATPAEYFPQRARFEALKAEGQLTAPAEAARAFVAYLLSAAFGDPVTADLRELASG